MNGPAFTDLAFSPTLRDYLIDLLRALDDAGVAWLLPRGIGALPDRAGFDLDVLVADDALAEVARIGLRAAADAGLVAAWQEKGRGGKLAVLDLSGAGDRRRWLLLDAQTRLRFSGRLSYTVHSIDIERVSLPGNLVANVPTARWQVALAVLQALRKRRWRGEDARLLSDVIAAEGTELADFLARRFAVSGRQLDLVALAEGAGPAAEEHLVRLGRILGVTPFSDGRTTTLGWGEGLKRWLFFRLFMVPSRLPRVVVILGADGVGKTTVLQRLQAIFSAYPILIDSLHHSRDTKGKAALERQQAALERDGRPRGVVFALTRGAWHALVPNAVKEAFWAVVGEVDYARRLNRLLAAAHYGGRLAIVDRYCYDRSVRMDMLPRSWLQKAMVRLNCRLMKRPAIAIMLEDDPERIHSRKQELSVAEIARYQKNMVALCRRVGVDPHRIRVAGRPPATLAAEAAGIILAALGFELFQLIGTWERRAEAGGRA